MRSLLSGPAFNTAVYTWPQIFWYMGGFLVWTPAYVVIIRRAWRDHSVEIPIVAACGNVTWEFLWGFVFKVNMGWVLQVIYMGACILDLFILWNVFRYGAKQVTTADVQPVWPLVVAGLLLGWGAFYVSLRHAGYDLPLGSVSAYLVNLVMSTLYLWYGLTRGTKGLSIPVAWSKFLGTAMVSVFVFLVYRDNAFVCTLAVMVAVLDVTYLVFLYANARGRDPLPAGATAIA